MMPGLPDLQFLLAQAQQMQADMVRTQTDLSQAEVTGHAGGGLVSATVTGDGLLKALVIDPSVVDPADVETLADLIIAAVRDASRSAAEIAGQAMGSVTGGLSGLEAPGGFDLSAFGLPALGGLLGADEYDEDEDDDDLDEDDDDLDDEEDDEYDELPGDAQVVDADVIDADVIDADVIDADAEVVNGGTGGTGVGGIAADTKANESAGAHRPDGPPAHPSSEA